MGHTKSLNMKSVATIFLAVNIASASAFAPSPLQNVALHSTELNARPKLGKKKAAVSKATSDSRAPISFPKPKLPSFQLPWDKPEAVTPVKAGKKGKGKAKLAEKMSGGKSLSSVVFDMDLWAPVADSNDYGARRKKNLVANGKLAKKSYVPSGLSKAQYEKVRAEGAKKKKDNYDRNVAKAGKFSDFYAFYKNRGTDTKDSWRDVTNSHTMAKTKYDWQGDDDMGGFGSSSGR